MRQISEEDRERELVRVAYGACLESWQNAYENVADVLAFFATDEGKRIIQAEKGTP